MHSSPLPLEPSTPPMRFALRPTSALARSPLPLPLPPPSLRPALPYLPSREDEPFTRMETSESAWTSTLLCTKTGESSLPSSVLSQLRADLLLVLFSELPLTCTTATDQVLRLSFGTRDPPRSESLVPVSRPSLPAPALPTLLTDSRFSRAVRSRILS